MNIQKLTINVPKQSFSEMLEKYDYVNPDITEQNFPLSENFGEMEAYILNFEKRLTTQKIITKMEEEGLRPASLRELCASEAQNDYVLALGSRWDGPDGHVRVPCLDRDGGQRGLGLDWYEPGHPWLGSARFLALKKESSFMKPSHKIREIFEELRSWREINDFEKIQLKLEAIITYLDEEYENQPRNH